MDRNNLMDGRSIKIDRPTKLRTGYRLSTDENAAYDRVKTEPDYVENRLPTGSRLDEIKGKYGFKRERSSSGLSEISSQNLMNLNNLRIRQVDSPINSLQKGRQNFEFVQALESVNLREPSQKSQSDNSQIDPRIQNIDKINSKIKNILSSFDRIEQELLGNHGEGRTRKHGLLPSQNKEKQISYEKDFDKRVKEAAENAKHNNDKLMEQYFSNKYDSKNKTIHIQRPKEDSSSQKRDIDSQIQSINDRLERRRPSSNYSDYFTLKNSSNNSQSNLTTITVQKPERPIFQPQPLAYQTFKKQSRQKIESHQQPKESKQEQKKDIKINKENFDYKDFKKETREPQKDKQKTKDKSQPQEQIIIEKAETKRFFRALKRQVELDEEFRNKKYAFKQIREEDKLSHLISELVGLGVRIQSRQQLLSDLKISQDQFNPFFTCRADTDFCSIAKSYAEAKEHWDKQVLGAFKQSTLQQEGFSENSIDLDRKGYMTVEDFVRLLNLQADAFVRNRDLVLIYRRLTTTKQLKFNDLLDQICSSEVM